MLTFGRQNDNALTLYGIQTMQFNMALGTSARLWSHDPASPNDIVAPIFDWVRCTITFIYIL